MAVLYKNNAASTLASGINTTATSIVLASGGGAKFPAVTGSDFFYLTILDGGGNFEIVKVTVRTVDTLTVVRAQEGTTALTFASGVICELRITGGLLDQFKSDTATSITSSNVTNALGFTPYNASNPSGYITGITSGNVTTALGFTPYNATNPSGYISGITSANVTTALGYTPYNSTNPSGYITNSALSGYLTSASASSTYLPLSGGTVTGAITFAAGQTWPTFNQSTTGSAATLTTGRTIALTGDVTYTSGSFNGSANVTGTATLANSGVTAGTYTKVTVDAKGRVTVGASLASADLPTYTGTITSSQVTTGLGFTPYNATNPSGYITSSASITGSAATLTTARTLTIGSTGKTFNGSANVSWSLAEIGALGASAKAADSELLDGYNSDRFWRLYSDNNMESGVHGGSINGTGMQYLLTNHVQNLFQHNAPTTYEVWNGSAYVSQTVPTHIFKSDANSNFGAFTIANGTAKVRFTWTSFGYRFWSTLATAGSTNGNSFRVRFYTSADQTTWVERFTSGYVSDWPGYHVWPFYYGDSAYPHIRLELEFTWSNANACTFGDIALMGAYGGYTKTFDWDYARNMYFSNAFITGSNHQVLHAGNYNSYALPLSGGNLSGDLQLLGNYLRFDQTGTRSWNMRATGGNLDLTSGDGNGSFRYNGGVILTSSTYTNYALPLTAPSAQTLRFDTAGGEHITFQNQTSGGAIQLGFQQNDTDGLHHRAYFKFYKGSAGGVAGAMDIIMRSVGGGTTTDILRLQAGSAPTWAGSTMLTAGNYNSYSPTLTGGGASGTWGISISGNAATATTATNQSGGTVSATTGAFSGVITGNIGGYARFNAVDQYHSVILRGTVSGSTTQTITATDVMEFIEYGGVWNFRQVNALGTNTIWATVNTSGISWNGNTVLHAGNYSSYALPLGGGTVTGTTTFSQGLRIGPTPGDPNAYIITRTMPSGDPNAASEATELLLFHSNDPANGAGPDYITLRAPAIRFQTYDNAAVGDPDASSGWNNRITISPAGVVNVPGTLQQGGNQVLHAGNINSYIPSWSTGVNGSHLVQRDGNGYIYANHVNFNTGIENPPIDNFITGNGDGWSRKSSLAHVKNSIRGIADGTWGINVTGNAESATRLINLRTINGGGFDGTANIDTTEWFHSGRDFPSGTLITTNINYAVTYGDPFVLEIRGNSYGNIIPLDLQYQGYIYSDTIINHGGLSNGLMIQGLVAINNGGNLCFWFPSQGYWNGYNVKVYTAYATRAVNRVTSITGTGKPTTAKEVALTANIRQSLHSDNFGNYALPLSGGTVTGTLNTSGRFYANNGIQISGAFILAPSGATYDNSTGMRMTENYGALWNGSNSATWHHQIINGSSLVGFQASGGNFGNGNILASGNVTAYYSDERLKTKITTIQNALDKVRSLEGFIYVENELAKSVGYTNSGEQAGVSAQRVKAVLPQAVSLAPFDMQGVPETGEVVSKSGENYLTVDYSRLSPLLIEAIKEQDQEVIDLRTRVAQLEFLINQLIGD